MVEFFVYSRPAVEAVPPHDVPHIFISIITPSDKEANIKTNEHTCGVLRLAFDDVDNPVRIFPSYLISGEDRETIMFSDEMAQQVIDFVKQHKLGKDINRCIIHCDAGRSRSRGLASALSLIFNGDDKDIIKGYAPNMLVYRKILNCWYGDSYEV